MAITWGTPEPDLRNGHFRAAMASIFSWSDASKLTKAKNIRCLEVCSIGLLNALQPVVDRLRLALGLSGDQLLALSSAFNGAEQYLAAREIRAPGSLPQFHD